MVKKFIDSITNIGEERNNPLQLLVNVKTDSGKFISLNGKLSIFIADVSLPDGIYSGFVTCLEIEEHSERYIPLNIKELIYSVKSINGDVTPTDFLFNLTWAFEENKYIITDFKDIENIDFQYFNNKYLIPVSISLLN